MGRGRIIYGGRSYSERADGYYGGKLGLLHRVVYATEVGPIPDGWHVHHLDHDKANNAASNLVTLSPTDHAHEHDGVRGPEWHAAGGRASAAGRIARAGVCELCGTEFTHRGTTPARFCSPRCRDKGAPSRAHEERLCSVCGGRFTCPRRNPTRTCSPPCRSVAAYAARTRL